MDRYKNILFVVTGSVLESEAVHRTCRLVGDNRASLKILILHPDLPEQLQDVEDEYRRAMTDRIEEILQAYDFEEKPSIVFETAKPALVTIIQHVLKHDHDLLIKQAELTDGDDRKRGFRSLDMGLLRKCPCPVWLDRPFQDGDRPRILVAIDPISVDAAAHDLSIKLLQTAASLAQKLNGNYAVISCWELEYENFLRDSPFSKTAPEEVDDMMESERTKHREALDNLIGEAGTGDPDDIIHEKGKAYDIIPAYIDSENIDILVMGTVARTGIPGFIIGNTAENILRNITCGMIAAKPGGFVSPIKAY